MSQNFKLTRRAALAGAAGLGLAATACSREEQHFEPRPPADGPFKHGVASGDPDQTSIMLWTAVTTDSLEAPVRVELSEDPSFTALLLEAEAAHAAATVNGMTPFKLLADGLQPGREYYYRFRFGEAVSETGRTRTLPAGAVERFNIAAFSCSNYPAGFFNAYRDAAERGDIDLVIHLGDYLYEYGRGGYAMDDDERLGRVVEPAHEIVTYEDYVTRYAQYGADPDLKALKASAPWLTIWDDHETANNAHLTGAENHDPDEGEGAWSERVEAALRAYYGWLPVREPDDRRARYGALEIGDLATLIFLESRLLARSDEMTLDHFPVPLDSDPEDPLVQETVRNWLQARVGGEDRTLLGAEQYDFVLRTLEQSVAAGKPWRIFANQVLMGSATAPDYTQEPPLWLRWGMRLAGGQVWDFARQTRFGVPMTLDTWDGFPVERERLFEAARAANADFIVLTGDSHNFWTVDLKTQSGERVGVEFGVTSVTSPSDYEFVNAPSVDFGQMTLKANPHILHHSVYAKGYVLLSLTPEEAVADFVSVSTIKDTAFERGLDSRWRVTPAMGGSVPEVERIS